MIFPYTEYSDTGKSVFRPTVRVVFSCKGTSLIVGHALVDTGADKTLLPLSMATAFGFTFDLEKEKEMWGGAGGGSFPVYRSPMPIEYKIEQQGFRPIVWKAPVYFTLHQPTILLGHDGFLEKFNLLFKGKDRLLELSV